MKMTCESARPGYACNSSDKDSLWVIFRTGYYIKHPVHAIYKIDIQFPALMVHYLSPGCSSLKSMAGPVLLSTVGFHLRNSEPVKFRGASLYHNCLTNQLRGNTENISRIESSQELFTKIDMVSRGSCFHN